IAASGLEHPAQLGATFLADAAQLRAWYGATPPLTDDFPKRIAAPPPPGQRVDEYARLLDPQAALRAFSESDWIRQHWPEAFRQQSTAFFALQPVLNGELAPDAAQRLALVDAILRNTRLQVPVYWLLGSD